MDVGDVTMHSRLFLLALFAGILYADADCPITYAKSPFPVSQLYIVNDSIISPTELVTLQSLGGTISKGISPMIYRVGDPKSSYSTWLSDIAYSTDVVLNYEFYENATGVIDTLISTYDIVVGLAVYSDVNDISLSMAVSYCAGSNGVIAVTSLEASHYISTYQLNVSYDATTSTTLPDHLQFSQHAITFQQPSAQLYLIEYSVFTGAPFMAWDDPRRDMSLTWLGQVSRGCAAAFGWVGDEGEYVSYLAHYGVFVHASDWAKNMAPLSNIDMTSRAHPLPPASASTTSRGQEIHTTESDDNAPVHTVTFVMTDGDNLQWLLGSFLEESWFGSPDLSNTPMSFTLSPALATIAPPVLAHLQSSATNNMADVSFVAAPSGLGYTYSELLEEDERQVFANETALAMSAIGTRIVNLLAGGDDVSDEMLLQASSAFLTHENIDCIFYYTYGSGYAGGGGKVLLTATDKPIITARFSLWGDNNDPSISPMLSNDGMIEVLQQQVRDSSSVDGYSLIPVHAWSHTVADVRYIMENVGEGVQVLEASAFLEKFTRNVKLSQTK